MALQPYTNQSPEEIYKEFYKFGSRKNGTYFELPEGPEERYGKRTEDLNKINWLSIEDLELHEDLLGEENEVNGLRAVLNMEKHKANLQPKYITNTVLCHIAGFNRRGPMCQCGTTGTRQNEPLREKMFCKGWKFCDRCAAWKRSRYYTGLVDYFNKSIYDQYMITLTLDHKYHFNEATYDLIEAAWDKLSAFADVLVKSNVIAGGLRVEELSVDSLYPSTIVNPHIHILCSVPKEVQLQSGSFGNIKIHIDSICDKADWTNKINYMFKSIELGGTYLNQWNIKTAETVNRNLKNFIHGYHVVFFGRKQISSCGIYNKRCKNHILMSKSEYYKLIGKKQKNKKACKPKTRKIQYTESKEIVQAMIPDIHKPSSTAEKLAFQLPSLDQVKTTLGNIPGQLTSKVVNPAMERMSPYLSKGLEKAPIPQDWRNSISSHLAPSVDEYKNGITNLRMNAAQQGQLGEAMKLGPARLMGTQSFDGINTDGLKQMMDQSASAAGEFAKPGFYGAVPKMTTSLMQGIANTPGLRTIAKPLGALGRLGEAGLNKGTSLLSHVPGASTALRGYSRLLGPAAAVMSAPETDTLAQKATAWNLDKDNFDALGNVKYEHALDVPNITSTIANAALPPGMGMAKGLLDRYLRSQPQDPSQQGAVTKVLRGAEGLGNRALYQGLNGVGAYFTGGLSTVAPGLLNNLDTNRTEGMLDSAAARGGNDMTTRLFNEAVRMKDQGFENPLKGWYASQTPESLKQYTGGLQDQDLVRRIQELNPNR